MDGLFTAAIVNTADFRENMDMHIKLIKNYENIADGKITLFCLPYAGGGASFYNHWVKRMQEAFTVCPIQLPGREERIMEQPYENMNVMLDDLEQAILNVIKAPYALWGHSMGGKIAYELEKRMEKHGYMAKCLFVSGSRAPHIPEPEPIYYLPDLAFKEKLGRFEGTPKELLDNQELLEFFLPMLRADFTMDETYCTHTDVLLKCPIIAFGGEADREANEDEVKAWKKYTENYFDYQMFPGGHFYVREHEEDVIHAVTKQLWRISDEE